MLILLGYDGKYIDYGTLGLPEKDIREPSGETEDQKKRVAKESFLPLCVIKIVCHFVG